MNYMALSSQLDLLQNQNKRGNPFPPKWQLLTPASQSALVEEQADDGVARIANKIQSSQLNLHFRSIINIYAYVYMDIYVYIYISIYQVLHGHTYTKKIVLYLNLQFNWASCFYLLNLATEYARTRLLGSLCFSDILRALDNIT